MFARWPPGKSQRYFGRKEFSFFFPEKKMTKDKNRLEECCIFEIQCYVCLEIFWDSMYLCFANKTPALLAHSQSALPRDIAPAITWNSQAVALSWPEGSKNKTFKNEFVSVSSPSLGPGPLCPIFIAGVPFDSCQAPADHLITAHHSYAFLKSQEGERCSGYINMAKLPCRTESI